MRNLLSRVALLTLLLSLGGTAMAQYHAPRPSTRHHYSRTDKVLRGLDAVETAAEYAMLGNMLHHIADYTGLRLGFNSATLRIDDASYKGESIIGADLGIVFGWYLGHSHVFSIEPGLYYSMKGGRMSHNYTYTFDDVISGSTHHNAATEHEDIKMTMHTFELPVVLKGHLPIAPMTTLQPFAGLFAGFGFAGTSSYNVKNTTEKFDTYDDGVLEDFDAGVRFGLGLSTGHLYLEAAYDYGLLNLDANFYNFDLRSSTWSFNVGYNF